MSRSERHHEAALDVADWLDAQGEPFRANAVRAVCRSLRTSSSTLSQLHRDNMDLRALLKSADDRLSPLERAKASYRPMQCLDGIIGIEREVAQGIAARSDETAQPVRPEGQEPGPQDAP